MAYDAGNIEYSVGVNTVEAEKGAERIEKSVNKVDAKMSKVAKSTKKASSGFAGIGRNAGQAGIQVQQFVGQVQGGQSAMLALSQQAADLGIVLGLPLVGSIVGIGAAIVGSLIPSINAADEEIKEILPTIDELIEKIESLTVAQKDYVKSEISKEILKQEDALTVLNNEINSLIKNNRYLLRDEKANSKQIDEQSEKILKLRAERDQTIKTIDRHRDSLNKLTSAESNNATNSVNSENATIERIKRIAELNNAMDIQIETLGMSQREIALYTASQLAVGDVERSIVEALKQKINAHYDEVDAIKQKEEAERELKKTQQADQRLKSRVASIGLTPIDEIQARYDLEQDLLEQALEKKLITQIEFAEKEKQITKEKVEAINAYNSQQVKNQQMFSDTQGQMLGALGNTFGAFAGAMDKSNKESFEKQKKFATAQALINTLLSISYAMANPWPLNLALSAAAAISGAATVAQINSQQFSGGREMGGPVSANSVYRVGERGPEIFTAGGQNYMIPGEAGQVINNKNAFGGTMQQQQPSVINLTFNASGSIDKDFESFIINNQDLIYSSVSAAKSENGEMF